MTIANQQIVNKPLLYVNNAQISWASATTLSIAVSQERDSTNVYDISTTSAITLNTATVGLNGLDTGALVAGTWYYIFAIGDSLNYKAHGFIMSASSTAPYLPSGYDALKLVGYWRTNVSAQLIKGYVMGNGSNRTFWYDAEITALTNGSSATYAAVSLANAVPPVDNTFVTMTVSFAPNTAADYVTFRPTGSTATVTPRLSGVVATQLQIAQMKVLSKVSGGNASIDYINSAASCSSSAAVTGFEYYI